MSCFVVNESGRSLHVTLDPNDEDPGPNRYNLVISKDDPNRKRQRHLEQFRLKPAARRQIYCMLEPFSLQVTLLLPSAVWGEEAGDDGAILVVVRDFYRH